MSKNYVIEKCTCGRENFNLTNLAVIIEEYHRGSRNGVMMNSQYSTIVCLNKKCFGRFKSREKYVEKLPKITWDEYNKRNRKEKENGKA
jgi:hypothetical protein